MTLRELKDSVNSIDLPDNTQVVIGHVEEISGEFEFCIHKINNTETSYFIRRKGELGDKYIIIEPE